MSEDKNQVSIIEKQNTAISAYLDDLLKDVPNEEIINEPVKVVIETKQTIETPVVEEIPKTADIEVPLTEEKKPVKIEQPELSTSEETLIEFEKQEVNPNWKNEAFQALLFKIGGLSLAVPLINLYGVIPWTDKITRVPNKTDWYLGLLNHRDQNVRVVDTNTLVKGSNVQASPEYKHIMLVDGGKWGLTSEKLGDVVTLNPDQVKWRTSKGKRPWLAGTVLDKLCALIDADAFAKMLDEENIK